MMIVLDGHLFVPRVNTTPTMQAEWFILPIIVHIPPVDHPAWLGADVDTQLWQGKPSTQLNILQEDHGMSYSVARSFISSKMFLCEVIKVGDELCSWPILDYLKGALSYR